ncbi:MAG: NfeD family protein [Ruminococcus sp.]|nr:NfeD family protein [Ruminococcus sp.]
MEVMPYIWFGLAVFLAVIEATTYQLVSIWFVAGGLSSAVLSIFMPDKIWLQIVVFVAVSLIALIVTRPLVRKITKTKIVPTNSDRYIGKSGFVQDEINNEQGVGRVKIDGSVWSAKSEDDSVIPSGTKILVKEIKGVKVIVTPVKE